MAGIRIKQSYLVGTSSLDKCRYIKFYRLSELPTKYNYQDLEKKEPNYVAERHNNTFIYSNNNGIGFNVLLYFDSINSILGFTTLFEVYGENISDSNRGFRRDYKLSNIQLSLLVESNEILIDKYKIRLISEINTGKSRNEYPFIKRKDYSNSKSLNQVYTSSLSNIEKNMAEGIVTEFSIYDVKNSELNKIEFANNIKIEFNFSNSQISYIGLDPSLCLWDNNGRFQVISLTKTMDTLFGTNTGRPFPYTTPKTKVSKTDVYELPELEGEAKTISYFAGKYIVTSDGYIFDYLSYSWLKSGNNYLRNIVIDTLDPKLKIWQCSTLSWDSISKAVREFSPISNSYADFGSILENRFSIERKTGEWLVFRSDKEKIYTNLTKMVVTDINDPAYLLNNQCIVVEHEGTDYLFSDPGFWSVTSREPDSISYNQKYNSSSNYLSKYDRGLSGFWKYFRKGITPKIHNTRILDTFGGIVFYLDSNSKIKYM